MQELSGKSKGRTLNQRSSGSQSLGHRESKGIQKNIYCHFIDYTKAFECGSQQTGKFFIKMGIPNQLTCLLRNLFAGQEATVRIRHGTMDWLQTEKGV